MSSVATAAQCRLPMKSKHCGISEDIPFIGINGLVAAYPRARAMTPTLFAAVSINTRQQNKTNTE